jgi:hypothetical protein
VSPFMKLLVRTVKSVRAAGLRPAPPEPAKDGPPGKAVERDWEALGRDLGRAVRKFRDGGRPE